MQLFSNELVLWGNCHIKLNVSCFHYYSLSWPALRVLAGLQTQMCGLSLEALLQLQLPSVAHVHRLTAAFSLEFVKYFRITPIGGRFYIFHSHTLFHEKHVSPAGQYDTPIHTLLYGCNRDHHAVKLAVHSLAKEVKGFFQTMARFSLTEQLVVALGTALLDFVGWNVKDRLNTIPVKAALNIGDQNKNVYFTCRKFGRTPCYEHNL